MTRRTSGRGEDEVKKDGDKEDRWGGITKEMELDVKEEGQAGYQQGQAGW